MSRDGPLAPRRRVGGLVRLRGERPVRGRPRKPIAVRVDLVQAARYPESGQTIINVTNGKIIRLLVDDEPFDLCYGQVHRHQRVLDLQSGTLTREVRWSSPAGKTVKVRSERLVSLTQRAVAAICYEVEVVDSFALIVVQSELVANEQLPTIHGGDPRVEG